jgi:hypothetical protein
MDTGNQGGKKIIITSSICSNVLILNFRNKPPGYTFFNKVKI